MANSETTDKPSITLMGEIGVSMTAIVAARLCPACKARLLNILANDTRRLELERARLAGQLEVIDEICANES